MEWENIIICYQTKRHIPLLFVRGTWAVNIGSYKPLILYEILDEMWMHKQACIANLAGANLCRYNFCTQVWHETYICCQGMRKICSDDQNMKYDKMKF